ncbi:MAG: class I SAM-dependent methyltransferase [Anaerolineales bacterium]
MDQDIRYLAAKKRVDDRSLNPHVWDSVWKPFHGQPVRVLELGAGIGTMVERVLEHSGVPTLEYTAVDLNPTLLEEAVRRLAAWGDSHHFSVTLSAGTLRMASNDQSLTLHTLPADVRQPLPDQLEAQFDVVMANALLDLVDLRTVLPRLLTRVNQGGVFYFSINFDGVTIFEPEFDPAIDNAVMQSYHRSMDERRLDGLPAGHSQTGRRLLALLPSMGADILAAGPSDWIVHPTGATYQPDERVFLGLILDMIEQALRNADDLDPDDLSHWLAARRRQLAEGTLILLTHQVDVCGRII